MGGSRQESATRSSFRRDSSAECDAFLANYSRYRDGDGDSESLRALALHLESCAACRRYDRIVRRGVAALRLGLLDRGELSYFADQRSARRLRAGARAAAGISRLRRIWRRWRPGRRDNGLKGHAPIKDRARARVSQAGQGWRTAVDGSGA